MTEEINLEAMTEQELLVELVRQQKKVDWSRKLLVVFMAVITAAAVITALVLIPKAFQMQSKVDLFIETAMTTLSEFDVMISDIEELSNSANALITDNTDAITEALENVESISNSANALIEDNADAVTEALEQIKNIDFDSLNQSIKDLSDILEPMATFFNMF